MRKVANIFCAVFERCDDNFFFFFFLLKRQFREYRIVLNGSEFSLEKRGVG